MLNENFVKVSNALNFKVTLPVLLFQDMAFTNLREDFDGKLVLFCAVVTTVAFFAIWFLARRLIGERSLIGAFVQASYRCSVAVLGIAMITNIYGDAGPAPFMIIGCVPLFNIYAVLVLSVEGQGNGAVDWKKTARQIVTNPILVAIVLGTLSSLLGLSYPTLVTKALSSVAAMTTPQALLCIGAGFEGGKALAKIRPTLAASAIKLVVLPAVFLPLAIWLGFRDQALIAILIMLASPTTPSSYVMAENMGNDGVLASSVIVSTTLISAFTLTGWIFLVRYLGLVW
jgi:predicted permease